MPAYHQMGHDSKNLVDLPDLSQYAGAIYSPINCDEADAIGQIAATREGRERFEAIFDPQLYVPAVNRGQLSTWSYYPSDVDSSDSSGLAWWQRINKKLAKSCQGISADAICSPTKIPKVFDENYYAMTVKIAEDLQEKASNEVLLTIIANFADLTDTDRLMKIASITSQFKGERVYLVFVGTTVPRRELSDPEEIVGGMRLVGALEQSGLRVIVGFTSSDLLLWKYAGASSCATGKFFNLRRFTKSRFDEPKENGGKQSEYWFEEGLLAFLRQSDLLRLKKLDVPIFSEASAANPFCDQILENLGNPSPERWLSLGWRQFLYWFADIEKRLASGEPDVRSLLLRADTGWGKVGKSKVYMSERENDGSWIRVWLNAVEDLDR